MNLSLGQGDCSAYSLETGVQGLLVKEATALRAALRETEIM